MTTRGLWGADEELVGAIADALTERHLGSGRRRLNRWQTDFVIAWHAQGLVSCGGLHCFYQGFFDGPRVPGAFERLGFPRVASAFRRSMKAFPSKAVLTHEKARNTYMDEHKEVLEKSWSRLVGPIYGVDKKLIKVAAAHMRAHPREFESLDPIYEIDRVYSRAASRRGKLGGPEQNVCLVWHFYLCTKVETTPGIQFHRLDVPATVEALEVIGADEAALYVERAGELFTKLKARRPPRKLDPFSATCYGFDEQLVAVQPVVLDRLVKYVGSTFC